MDQTIAVMGVDAGGTTGISQMHIMPKRGKKHVDHPVVRWRAFEVPINWEVRPDPRTAAMDTLRGFTPRDPYLPYRQHAAAICDEWIRFRMQACRSNGYNIMPAYTFLAIENFTFGEVRNTQLETYSSLLIGQAIAARLHALADAYEMAGFGPAHVGSLVWIQPAEKELFPHEKLKDVSLFARDYSKSKRGRKMEHANDASQLCLVLARKLGIGELMKPFDGDRPEPFKPFRNQNLEEYWPGHFSGAYTTDPADPARPAPVRERSARRAGMSSPDRRSSVVGKSNPMRVLLTRSPDLVEYIMSRAGKPLVRDDVESILDPLDCGTFERMYTAEKNGWSRMKGARRIPSQRLLRVCHETLGKGGHRKLRRSKVLD